MCYSVILTNITKLSSLEHKSSLELLVESNDNNNKKK